MLIPRSIGAAGAAWAAAVSLAVTPEAQHEPRPPVAPSGQIRFATGETCMACHNGVRTPSGEDISFGSSWRGSMMANSSRDPYWQASVRREAIEHPEGAAEIEDECAVCHMPMSRALANAAGRKGEVFAHLAARADASPESAVARDGVSCTMCHQISAEKLGTPESFTGGFVVSGTGSGTGPPVFGPFQVDTGRTAVMQSASGFHPTEGSHIRTSEMCATCHTLYTNALGPGGAVVGRLPEQVPYLEWKHSAFAGEGQTCQACHMPVVREETPITSVLGTRRAQVARHGFRGGNFFMLRLLDRFRAELDVSAHPEELAKSSEETLQFLKDDTATVAIESVVHQGDRLVIDVAVRNRAGHKLPTGYPSRRAWLELTVRDASGRPVFTSGRMDPSGRIEGNDNDADPSRYEPHYAEIRESGEVQIYESVMADPAGNVTTGLLRAVRYVKDNRLLPRGFDKATAPADAAVVGKATADPDFAGGGDRVRYSVQVPEGPGSYDVEVLLRFQPIGFRWADNLRGLNAAETTRFVSYFDALAEQSSAVLARAAFRGSKGQE